MHFSLDNMQLSLPRFAVNIPSLSPPDSQLDFQTFLADVSVRRLSRRVHSLGGIAGLRVP